MTVFPHTNYSETAVVELCGGMAPSHTTSTTVDRQRDTGTVREDQAIRRQSGQGCIFKIQKANLNIKWNFAMLYHNTSTLKNSFENAPF